MNIEQINYNIDNFNQIKWSKESLKQFVEYLSNLDLNLLDNLTKQKVVNFLNWAQEQRGLATSVEISLNNIDKNKKTKKSIILKILLIIIIVLTILIIIGLIWYFLYTYIPKNFSDNVLYCVSNSDREDILEKEIRITFDESKKAIQVKRKSISSLFPFPIVKTLKDQEILYNLNAESLDYEEIKDFYLNKGYTCNGERRREVDLQPIFYRSIIDNDRLYFQSDATTISTVDLNGKNKVDIIKNIPVDDPYIDITLILDNDIYFIADDKKFKISLDNIGKIEPVTRKIEINKDALQEANLYEFDKMELNYFLFNGFDESNISRIIYNNEFIKLKHDGARYQHIYMGDDIIYESSASVYALAINENYLYFIEERKNENTKIVKFDLNSKTIVAELDTSNIDNISIFNASNIIYDYNANGIMYISNGNIFKLNYNTFTINFLTNVKKEDTFLDRIYYINNKIIAVNTKTQYSSNIQSILLYDEDTGKVEEYKYNLFQIANDNLYLRNMKIVLLLKLV